MESALGLDLGSQGFREVLAKVARFGSYRCSTGQSSDILRQVPTRSFKISHSFSVRFHVCNRRSNIFYGARRIFPLLQCIG